MTDLAFPLGLDDLAAWPELSYELGLSDGLPVHPPLLRRTRTSSASC